MVKRGTEQALYTSNFESFKVRKALAHTLAVTVEAYESSSYLPSQSIGYNYSGSPTGGGGGGGGGYSALVLGGELGLARPRRRPEAVGVAVSHSLAPPLVASLSGRMTKEL